jgi:penicillin-binding protein 2
MSHDKDLNKNFTRRYIVLIVFMFSLILVLLARLYYLQIIDGKKYSNLAGENCASSQHIFPERGKILDRFGHVLADNHMQYRLMLDSGFRKNLSQIMQSIETNLPGLDVERAELDKQLARRRGLHIVLLDNISWADVITIETNPSDFPGCYVEKYFRRFYPEKEKMVEILGYMGPNADKSELPESFQHFHEVISGKCGIEKKYQARLMGQPGLVSNEVNARGTIIRELYSEAEQPGEQLTLTIDRRLQDYTIEVLSDTPAASVTLDVNTGEVLAFVSTPGFDPQLFVEGIDVQSWQNLLNDPHRPLTNRVLKGLYPPGSIFKLAVALAALEEGVITPQDKFTCTGCFEHSGHPYHCWASRYGHGSVNLLQAMQRSCDVYFYNIALKIGVDKISAMANRLGLGVKTKIDLEGEEKGLVPTKQWKKKRYDKDWLQGDTVQLGIGQGYALATPLQLAVMMARIVNGGKKITPNLWLDRAQVPIKDMAFKKKNIDILKKSLNAVCNWPGGTGYKVRIDEKGYEMGGKSSTSQVKSITLEDRRKGLHRNENREWKHRDHALFAGYAPVNQPKYVTVVIVEHGGFGSKIAGPKVRDILLKAQQLYEE